MTVCPLCKKALDKAIFYGVEVDYCPKCRGLWFEKDELRLAKDDRDEDLAWLDINLWKDKAKFQISRGQKLCPACRMPLYEVNYGDSKIHPVKPGEAGAKQFNGVKVDICNLCYGIWLDRGEFKKIIEYLESKAKYEILHKYVRSLAEEFWEIFTGPETFKEEVNDFLIILKMLNYKFPAQHTLISELISKLPLTR
jgi:Zn-finger nucleic acid-binding protein